MMNNSYGVLRSQDPYHGVGQATGYAFSVPSSMKHPPSLRNILKELDADLPPDFALTPQHSGALLSGWAAQGVLLLNTALSVAPNSPGSHSKLGWEPVTNRIIQVVSDQSPGCVFILWGAHAQRRRHLIDEDRHLVIASAHPSPLSAHAGFFGSRPFSRANTWLTGKGFAPVRWRELVCEDK